MFCENCGQENSDTAKFCRKCGAGIDETETRVASRGEAPMMSALGTPPAAERVEPADDAEHHHEEQKIFSISPTLVFVKAGYVLAAVGALIFVGLASALFSGVASWILVALGLLLFLIPAFYHIKQRLIRYTLTENKIEIDSGLIARTTRNIPLRRIQDVTVQTTILQRLVGFGDLSIDNASEQGGTIILKNINSPQKYADALLKQMRRLER